PHGASRQSRPGVLRSACLSSLLTTSPQPQTWCPPSGGPLRGPARAGREVWARPERRCSSAKIGIWLQHALAVLTGLTLSPSAARAEIIDRVLAVVQGIVITQSDVTAASDLGLVTVAPTDDPLGAALSQLVDRQLILAEVERYAPSEPADEAIDRRIQAV